jgi:hypothetical protein
MAKTSHNDDGSWVIFAVGALVALVLVLGYAAWRGGQHGIDTLRSTDLLPNLRALPSPQAPAAPHVPDTPIPFRR